jgi:hypothetical protein
MANPVKSYILFAIVAALLWGWFVGGSHSAASG